MIKATIKDTTKQTASFTAYKKHQVRRSILTYMMRNYFYFPKDHIDCLSSYYIHAWEPKYFLSVLKIGTIEHNGKVYQVQYSGTDPSKIYKAARNMKGNSHVKISFRVANPEFGLPNVAMVKLYTNTEGKMR